MVIDIGRGSTQGVSGGSGVRGLNADDHMVVETDDLDTVPAGGVVTLSPGDEKVFLEKEFVGSDYKLMAIGANDVEGVTYRLHLGGDNGTTIETNSPLGLLNDPMSFPDTFSSLAKVSDYVRYEAVYDSSATGEVDVVGRMYIDTS